MSDVCVDDVYIAVDDDGRRVIIFSLDDGTDIGVMYNGISINGSPVVEFGAVVRAVLDGGGDG